MAFSSLLLPQERTLRPDRRAMMPTKSTPPHPTVEPRDVSSRSKKPLTL